jgi:hypothetical protein
MLDACQTDQSRQFPFHPLEKRPILGHKQPNGLEVKALRHVQLFAALASCYFCLAASAQVEAADLEGWDVFKFGMSVEEARQISRLPLQWISTAPLDNAEARGHAGVLGTDVHLASVPMRASLLFVNAIHHEWNRTSSGGQLAGFVFDAALHKACKEDTVRQAIVERYGPFASRVVYSTYGRDGPEVSSLSRQQFTEMTQYLPLSTVTRWSIGDKHAIRLTVRYTLNSECDIRVVYLDRGHAARTATPVPPPQSRF